MGAHVKSFREIELFFVMKTKWLRMAASALALGWVILAGCQQPGAHQPEHTALPDVAATVAPLQGAPPAGMATLEPAMAPKASATAAEMTAARTPAAPAGKLDATQASSEAVEKAKADLANKLGIPISEIGVVLVIGQEFTPDGFYCWADKGRTSKDEPTLVISGETILLEDQGSRFEYHTDGQTVTFCRTLH
jgi:hypothetical protein